MNSFENIVGYSEIKNELKIIADILKGNESYKKLGVKIPNGLLLHGEPGLGKTLMAKCLINESNRTCIVCRKDKPDGEFVKFIKEAFEKAKESAPSVVFLDDMDKFANGDEMHPDSEEYVTVQTCIDEAKSFDVFVLATANDINCLPDSLLRPGRFDRIIEVEYPDRKDSAEIIFHYLKDKNVADDVDMVFFSRLLEGNSCAELENVINEAGIYAGFEKSPAITKNHLLKASMKLLFSVPSSAFESKSEYISENKKRTVYHEAGHALARELLFPGSVTVAAVFKKKPRYGGFIFSEPDFESEIIESELNDAVVALSGMAATEHIFGIRDGGAVKDLDRAFRTVLRLVEMTCISGFHLHGDRCSSDELAYKQHTAAADEIERLYRKAKELVAKNTFFLERLASELMEKEILDMYDIERIKDECYKEKTA